MTTLHEKSENPKEPKGCYFGRLQEFLDIAARSAGGRYNTRSYEEFDVTSFEINTIHPFLQALVKEITEAFNIPDQLKGFTSIDPVSIPTKSEEIEDFGKEAISSLASFYGETQLINEVVVPSIIDKEALQVQYQAFKLFVIKDRLQYEHKQQSALARAKQQLQQAKRSREALKAISSKRKLLEMDKNIKKYEQKEDELSNIQEYTFEIMLSSWIKSDLAIRHPEITKVLKLAALIPPSTAEVERSFSLMKLICTRLRNRLLTENLGHCMRICKFRDLNYLDYDKIMEKWLTAENTKSKKRKVSSRL